MGLKTLPNLVSALVLLLGVQIAAGQNLFFGSLFTGSPPPDSLFTSDPNGAGLANILPTPGGPVSIDLDPSLQRVFWSDVISSPGQWQVRSASFTGGSPAVVASYPNAGSNYGLAVDSVNQRVYWTDGTSIVASNYNGSGLTTIVSGLVSVQAIEVDPSAGKVFWVDRDFAAPVIGSANLNGSSPQTLLAIPVGVRPSGLAADPATQTLFWSSLNTGTVFTTPYTGGSSSVLLSGLSAPAGLDFEPVLNRLYLVQKNLRTVAWTTPGGVGLTTVFSNGGEMWDIAAVVPEPTACVSTGMFSALLLVRLRRRRAVLTARGTWTRC